nr:hypothetical protein [Nonomuraea sp. SYSU D8015]
MTTELNTLATALSVKIDDQLIAFPDLAPERPRVGIHPTLSDAELVTLAVLSALLGFTPSGARCATPAPTRAACSPTCPGSPATTNAYAPPPAWSCT